jgi:photosystem II stability/assembly factor-like uncharacterized protein
VKTLFPILLLASFCFSSCKKDQIELLTQEVDSHTSLPLFNLFFVNDSVGYACGGDKYSIGIFLKTLDGGRTWTSPDSIIPKVAFTQYFFSASEGYVAGYETWLAYTNDSGATFSANPEYKLETNGIAFGDRLHGVRANGSGFADGVIQSTNDGGQSWTSNSLSNSLKCVVYADPNTAFLGGYGVIYKSTDAGQTFSPLDIHGDFFVAADFPSPSVGYFAGYQRMILKTTNGGNSFTKVMKENAPFASREHFEAIDFWDENNGFVAGDNGVMYQTNDGGEHWKKIKAFTDVTLRSIHLFSPTSGIVAGDNGKIFLFRD